MTSEGILEDPALFSRPVPSLPVADTGIVIDGVKITPSSPNQMEIALEYLDFCERFPARVLKIVRSHLMKYLYRYFDAHPQYREYFGNADSIEEFRAVCQKLNSEIDDHNAYASNTWYTRHQRPAHTHAGCSGQGTGPSGFSKGVFAVDMEAEPGSENVGFFEGMGMFDQ